MKSLQDPCSPGPDRADEAVSSWPIYEKDQTGAENSLEQWCDIAWGGSVIPTGEARVELVLEFMREWYRNTDYDWQSFYEDIATRSDLFPNLEEMERFIRLPALPPTFSLEHFFDLLDRWDDLRDTGTNVEQAAVKISACGIDADERGDSGRLRVHGVTVESSDHTDLPSRLDLLETVCAMQSSRLLRLPEEADEEVRFTNLKVRLDRKFNLIKPNPDQ